ncbi:Fanconi anemia complementation group E [Turdus rufiventris]|nr:Fanconi anemia complementation group E [Turdus rufiventris]
MAALRVLQRGQPRDGPGQAFPWQALTSALCAEEPSLEGPKDTLAVKPRLLLLPVLCQRNLFSLLLVVQDAVPRNYLHQLLQVLEQDSCVDPWVQTLGNLLRQGPRAEESSPLPTALSATCQQQLRGLCQKITQKNPEGHRKWNWCFSKQPGGPDSVPQGGKRKEVLEESLELDSEREGKRLLLEEVASEPLGPQECGDVEGEVPEQPSGDTSAQSTDKAAADSSPAPGELRKISQTELAAEVQSFVQMHGQGLKMLLLQESRHPELRPPPELSILNSCSPSQLEGLCSFLQLSSCPEPFLVRFCSWLLALTPDLSYTSAAVLAEQLFLRRVLSLTQPPSRHLMAALTSFCSKYSHPFCRVLVAAVLQEPGEGAEQTKLMCELVEDCLEPHSVHLVLSQVLEVPLSEKLLPVLQAVLGRQEMLPPELLDLLVLTLCQQAPAFATSLGFAKLVTAVLTAYQSQVSPAQRSSLAAVLDRSNAALKKSLQAVLEGTRQDEQCPGTPRRGFGQERAERGADQRDTETLEEPLLSLPSELSVLDRFGLHRVALTEQDLEAAFAHLALAFRCDVFTLQQRVLVEKRARDAAEENIQEELGQCRAALERLGRSCANAGCKETLEQLQHNLAVLSAAVERATSAAEKLGAVHQEARMSRAAEVMVQHVENLKRHHLREHAELEEMKRLIQQNSRNRQLAETQGEGSARRRVSIAVIPKQLLHYWVFFWLLLLSIAFLLLIRVLELQRLQSAASSKA